MDPYNFQLPLEHWLFIIGIGLLVIEIAFFGFATFVLFFVGIAMLIIGALMAFGVLPVGIDSIQRFTQVQVIKADVGQFTVTPAEVL